MRFRTTGSFVLRDTWKLSTAVSWIMSSRTCPLSSFLLWYFWTQPPIFIDDRPWFYLSENDFYAWETEQTNEVWNTPCFRDISMFYFRQEYAFLDSRLENIDTVLKASADPTDQTASRFLPKYQKMSNDTNNN